MFFQEQIIWLLSSVDRDLYADLAEEGVAVRVRVRGSLHSNPYPSANPLVCLFVFFVFAGADPVAPFFGGPRPLREPSRRATPRRGRTLLGCDHYHYCCYYHYYYYYDYCYYCYYYYYCYCYYYYYNCYYYCYYY